MGLELNRSNRSWPTSSVKILQEWNWSTFSWCSVCSLSLLVWILHDVCHHFIGFGFHKSSESTLFYLIFSVFVNILLTFYWLGSGPHSWVTLFPFPCPASLSHGLLMQRVGCGSSSWLLLCWFLLWPSHFAFYSAHHTLLHLILLPPQSSPFQTLCIQSMLPPLPSVFNKTEKNIRHKTKFFLVDVGLLDPSYAPASIVHAIFKITSSW